MGKAIAINGQEIPIKEYEGRRVVTFKEIDQVHGRKDGTARKRFYDNRRRFIEGTDYFRVCPPKFQTNNLMSVFRTLEIPNRGLILITETGYLMLVKSFTDDLSWRVQRELVNSYFNGRKPELLPNSQVETFETVKLKAQSICMLADMGDRYESETYLYPIRSSIWMMASEILSDAWRMGSVVKEV